MPSVVLGVVLGAHGPRIVHAPGGAFAEDKPDDLAANPDLLPSLGLSAVPEGLANYNGFWGHAFLGGYVGITAAALESGGGGVTAHRGGAVEFRGAGRPGSASSSPGGISSSEFGDSPDEEV